MSIYSESVVGKEHLFKLGSLEAFFAPASLLLETLEEASTAVGVTLPWCSNR